MVINNNYYLILFIIIPNFGEIKEGGTPALLLWGEHWTYGILHADSAGRTFQPAESACNINDTYIAITCVQHPLGNFVA